MSVVVVVDDDDDDGISKGSPKKAFRATKKEDSYAVQKL